MQGFSALHLAARANKEDVVHLLLQANIIYRGQSKLSASLKKGFTEKTYRGIESIGAETYWDKTYQDITYRRYNISGLNLIGRQILSAGENYWDKTYQLDRFCLPTLCPPIGYVRRYVVSANRLCPTIGVSADRLCPPIGYVRQ
jgi:hypothetical protein